MFSLKHSSVMEFIFLGIPDSLVLEKILAGVYLITLTRNTLMIVLEDQILPPNPHVFLPRSLVLCRHLLFSYVASNMLYSFFSDRRPFPMLDASSHSLMCLAS
jgi:hypothetical protein